MFDEPEVKAKRRRKAAPKQEGVFEVEVMVVPHTEASLAATDRFWDSFSRRVVEQQSVAGD
jgi:hypothetical protein